jgi:Peptidoglycan-synthase activator LpoB
MMTSRTLILPALVFLVAFASCEAERPMARIKGDNERDEVGSRAGGAATFGRLVDATVSKLLEPYKGEFAELKVRSLAFVDLENRTQEELGEWREQLIDKIEASVNDRREFKAISIRFVSTVLKEMGNPPVDKLFLPKGRREFAKIMEAKSSPVQYLMWGRLTRGVTQGEGRRQADYVLSLELINIETGEQNKKITTVRKEYNGG